MHDMPNGNGIVSGNAESGCISLEVDVMEWGAAVMVYHVYDRSGLIAFGSRFDAEQQFLAGFERYCFSLQFKGRSSRSSGVRVDLIRVKVLYAVSVVDVRHEGGKCTRLIAFSEIEKIV